VSFKPVSRRQFLGSVAAGFCASSLLSRSANAFAPPQAAPTALVADAICKCHVPGSGRPECPQRYDAVLNALAQSPGFGSLRRFKPRPATSAEVRACHTDAYVQEVRREIESGARRLSTGCTFVCRDSMKAAY
jgi:acetoin utilization deacetylase AcuC-like enzyme